MMNFGDVRRLVAAGTSDVLRVCSRALDEGIVSDAGDGPGRLTAGEALATFAIRRITSATAGIETMGFDEVLRELNDLPPEGQVLIFSFTGINYIFSVFIDATRESAIGCIRIRKRDDMPPSLKDQGLA